MESTILGILGAFGLSFSAGLNAYIPLLIVSLLGRFTDLIQFAKPWDALTSWWTIGVLIVLVVVEAFADKAPLLHHANDLIQTFIRPTAGAILFAASAKTITEISPILSVIAGILVAGSVHVAKSAAVRPLISAASAGTASPVASFIEDILATALSVLSVVLPVLMLIFLILTIWWVVWIVRKFKRKKNRVIETV
ncbi:MAG TPA: DUF4126 domain-containing protein [Anaerolineaceae bacterium]|nr:DUF4126 domain-containing protein [Anaerolineaceae bacterium]